MLFVNLKVLALVIVLCRIGVQAEVRDALKSGFSKAFLQHMHSNGLRSHTNGVGGQSASFELFVSEFLNLQKYADKYIVNVGANDGAGFDPAYPLYKKGFAGLCIEGDPKWRTILPETMARANSSSNVHVLLENIHPQDVETVFKRYSVPYNFGILKVDIDSVDLPVSRAIINLYRPTLFMIEVNPFVPPPLSYVVESFDPDPNANHTKTFPFTGHGGTSITRVFEELTALDYTLVAVELGSRRGRCRPCEHNTYFVRGDVFDRLSEGGGGGVKKPDIFNMANAYWYSIKQYRGPRREGPIFDCYGPICPLTMMACGDKGRCRYKAYPDGSSMTRKVTNTPTAVSQGVCDLILSQFAPGDKVTCSVSTAFNSSTPSPPPIH